MSEQSVGSLSAGEAPLRPHRKSRSWCVCPQMASSLCANRKSFLPSSSSYRGIQSHQIGALPWSPQFTVITSLETNTVLWGGGSLMSVKRKQLRWWSSKCSAVWLNMFYFTVFFIEVCFNVWLSLSALSIVCTCVCPCGGQNLTSAFFLSHSPSQFTGEGCLTEPTIHWFSQAS